MAEQNITTKQAQDSNILSVLRNYLDPQIIGLVNDLAAEGYGIIVISSELPEILGMSDRILVMQDGRISGELPRAEAAEEAVLNLAMSEQMTQPSTEN